MPALHPRWFCLLGLLLLPQCVLLRPLPAQLDSRIYQGPTSRHEKLWIFLPGAGDKAEDFYQNGWVDSFLDRNPSYDVMTVDLHADYYLWQQALARMIVDVIEPAADKGYQKIYLCGISMGAFGDMQVAQKVRSPIAGLVLVAPYLGLYEHPRFIDLPREKWPQENVGPAQWLVSQQEIPYFVLYGDRDLFARSITKLRKVSGQGEYLQRPGSHKWKTWNQLWREFLDNGGYRAWLAQSP